MDDNKDNKLGAGDDDEDEEQEEEISE